MVFIHAFLRSSRSPLFPLLSHNALSPAGQTSEFPEHVNAVMDEKVLDHKVRSSVASRVQVTYAACYFVRTRAALVHHSVG
jgi:hypothetical protein